MTPTRSTTLRRKRDSTGQALDILNSVMDKKILTRDNRQTQSPRTVRQWRSAGRAPRRDIFEIPNSPEGERGPISMSSALDTSQPLIPRRSLRIQHQVQVQPSPLRRPLRRRRAGSEELGDIAEHGEQERGSYEENDDEAFGRDMERTRQENEEDDLVGGFNFFPDDARTPSPSSILLGELESTGQSGSSPDKRRALGQDTGTGASDEGLNRGPLEAYRSSPRAAVSGPSVMIHNSPSRVPETPLIQRERPTPSRPAPLQAEFDSENVEMGETEDIAMDGDENRPGEDTGSNYEPTESAESSSPRLSLFVPQETPPLPATRSAKQRQIPDSRAPRSSRAREKRPVRNVASYSISHSNQEPEKPERNYPRCREAMRFGQQQGNWDTLIKEGRVLEGYSNPGLAENFRDVTDLIFHLQRWYANLHSPSSNDVRQCEKLLDSISREGDQILDDVYYLAVRRRESSREKSRSLFQEFEARVFPAMIQLIFAVFDAYHTNPGRFPEAYHQLNRTMTLLLQFCNRMNSLTRERYVRCTPQSLNLRTSLQQLIEASGSDQLNKPTSEPNSSDSGSEDDSNDADEESVLDMTWRPWTDIEDDALIDGLLQHRGSERYVLILTDFSDELGGRTIKALRHRAQEMHDQWVPLIQDELGTREGQDRYRWLLSVRG